MGVSAVMHYAGRLVIPHRRGDGMVTVIYPGWVACSSGKQSQKIRDEGRTSFVRAEVTCRRCLALIERADRHQQAERGRA